MKQGGLTYELLCAAVHGNSEAQERILAIMIHISENYPESSYRQRMANSIVFWMRIYTLF